MAKTKQLSTLAYAVRGRVIGKYLGQLGLVLVALQVVPFCSALFFREYRYALAYGAVAAVVAAICGPLARLPGPDRIQVNEAMAITALIFTLAGLINVPAFLVAGFSPVDAVFEGISGVTTTGLSAQVQVATLPATILLARAWSEWYGGLGIVVLSMALLAGHSTAFRRLLAPETGPENLAATTRSYARRVSIIYVGMTLAGIAALLAFGVTPLHAASQVLTALSTGGFSSYDESLAALPALPVGVLSALSVAGAISLPIYFQALHRGWRAIAADPEVLALMVLIATFALLFSILLADYQHIPARQSVFYGIVLAISAQTTTGFTPFPIGQLPAPVLILLIVSMAVGGSLGSTAGGFKLMRVLILFRIVLATIRRTGISPRAITPHWWGGRQLAEHEVERVLVFMLLFVGVVVVSWIPFLFFGYAALPTLFEVVSATATVGLSTGITAGLPAGLKLLLCFDMLAGRVEIIAVLVLLYPGTWIGRRGELA